MSIQEELLRLKIATDGGKEVDAITHSLDGLADAGEEVKKRAEGLLKDFADAATTQRAVAQFKETGRAVLDLATRIDAAKAQVASLGKELSATEEPSKKQVAAFEAARASLARLEAAEDKQRAKLGELRQAIQAQGLETNNLVKAESILAQRRQSSVTALQAEVTAYKSARSEVEKKAAAQHEEEQAALRTVRANTSAAEALRKYRERAAEAATGSEQLGSSTKRLGGIFDGLKGAAAGLITFLSFRSLIEGVKNLLGLGDAAEKTRIRLASLFGSVDAGNAAFDKIRDIAKKNGQAFDTTLAAAAKLKTFGIDPLTGSLQAVIDENAKLGGSQENLEGIVLALGQAWAKQKLQGEEILQLVERGVPVWDLLAQATGKNVIELQKLSEQGKLGRETISQLIAEIGKSSQGAAAANLGTLSGLFLQAKDRAQQFLTAVANAGALDFFKAKISEAIAAIDRLQASGQLQAWAQRISDAIVSVGRAVAAGGAAIANHIGAIIELTKAYAAFKVAGFATEMATAATRLLTTTAAANAGAASLGLLGRVATTLRAAPLAAFALACVEVADALLKLNDAEKEQRQSEQDAADSKKLLIERIKELKDANAQFAGAATKSTAELIDLSRKQVLAYQDQLKGAITYYTAIRTEAKLAGDAAGMQQATAKIAELKGELAEVQVITSKTAEVFRGELSQAAADVAKSFTGVGNSAKGVADKIGELFKSFDTIDNTKLGDIGLGLVQVGKGSEKAATAVRDGLGKALSELTGEQLLKFQANSVAAFTQFGVASKDASAVLDATLLAAMEKLGVSPEKFGLGITEAGRNAIAAFQAITENANATAAQIENAFKAAIAGATSKEEIEQLGLALQAAADQGRIGFERAELAAQALQIRMKELERQADPLADQFAQLGIKSQRALEDARDAAERSFNAIVDGAQRGTAATEDVRRAFVAYAQAALAAAADSDSTTRAQVESQLRVQAAVFGVTEALQQLGLAGAAAGGQVASSADKAAASLDNLAHNADAAADSAGTLASAGEHAADNLDRVGQAASDTAIGLGSVSKAFLDAAASGGQLDRIEFGKLKAQQQAAADYLQQLEQQIAGTDELAQRIEALRAQYNLIGEDQLRVIAEKEKQLADFQQRKEEQAARDRGGQRDSGGGSGGGIGSGGVTVHVNVQGSVIGAGSKDELAESLARLIRPQLQSIERRSA